MIFLPLPPPKSTQPMNGNNECSSHLLGVSQFHKALVFEEGGKSPWIIELLMGYMFGFMGHQLLGRFAKYYVSKQVSVPLAN